MVGVQPAPSLLRSDKRPWLDAAGSFQEILRLARRMTAAGDTAEVLRLATEAACEVLGYGACAAALKGADGAFRFESGSGLGADQEQDLRCRVMSGAAYERLVGAALRLGPACWVPPGSPARAHPEVEAALLRTGVTATPGSWGQGSVLLVPLVDDGDVVVGFLNPDDPRSGELPDAAEAALLGSLAELTGVALGAVSAREIGRQALALAEAQRRQLEDLLTASVAVRGSDALDDVLGEIAQAMTSAGGFERAVIYLLEGDGVTMRARATVGLGPAEDRRLRSTPIPLEELRAMMQTEMQISRSFFFDHRRHHLPRGLDEKFSAREADPAWRDGMWHALDSLTVPLVERCGSLLGVISVDEPVSGRLPGLAHIRALEMFADQCSLAVEEASRYEQAVAEAGTDPLTGLANRRALLARADELISDSRRRQVPCAVAFLDLDHFKEVNDRFGHAVGDEVLVAVAGVIAGRLRAGDLVARYGGEELVAVLPGTALEAAVAIVEDLRRRVSAVELPKLGDHRVRVSAGVALVALGETLGEVLERADVALYEAKRAGRDRIAVAALA